MHKYAKEPLMAAERMTITVPSEMAAILRHSVEGGEYASTSEIVREALREWTRKRDSELRDLEALREAIKTGLDSGPGIPAEEVFAELRARYTAKS
jgi:antitoxin ParD1/3/4